MRHAGTVRGMRPPSGRIVRVPEPTAAHHGPSGAAFTCMSATPPRMFVAVRGIRPRITRMLATLGRTHVSLARMIGAPGPTHGTIASTIAVFGSTRGRYPRRIASNDHAQAPLDRSHATLDGPKAPITCAHAAIGRTQVRNGSHMVGYGSLLGSNTRTTASIDTTLASHETTPDSIERAAGDDNMTTGTSTPTGTHV